MTVVDLGSSPGGWSNYARKKIGKTGRIIACDLLPMHPIDGVEFLQGDCSRNLLLKLLTKKIGYRNKVQVVMSDMAPNISGIADIDIPRSISLGESALKIASNILEPNGTFIVKIFQGRGFEEYLKKLRFRFNIVRIRKPPSSRSRSKEVYIVASNHKDINL